MAYWDLLGNLPGNCRRFTGNPGKFNVESWDKIIFPVIAIPVFPGKS